MQFNIEFCVSVSEPYRDKRKETAGQWWVGVKENRIQDVRLVLKERRLYQDWVACLQLPLVTFFSL